MEVRDQRDEALPDVGTVWLRDPVSGRELQVDTGRAATRGASPPPPPSARRAARRRSRARDVRHAICRTDGDWLGALGTVLR